MVLDQEISCLTAWRVPECQGWPKMAEYDQITRLSVLIKTLNQKMSGEKKVYILAKNIDSKRKFEIKAKKISA